MFMLKERTWSAFRILGSPVASPRRVDWYRSTFTPPISGGGPTSRVRTSTLMRFASAIVMYFAWTPAPPYIAGGYSHVKTNAFLSAAKYVAATMKVPVRDQSDRCSHDMDFFHSPC